MAPPKKPAAKKASKQKLAIAKQVPARAKSRSRKSGNDFEALLDAQHIPAEAVLGGNKLPHPVVVNAATGKVRKATKTEVAKHKSTQTLIPPDSRELEVKIPAARKPEAPKRRVNPKDKANPKGKGIRGLDWAAIERDYRTDRFTYNELADKHGAAPATICRRAKEEGWKKDLSDAIRQATAIALVESEAKNAQNDVNETVAAQAELNKQVILKHRKDIVTFRDTVFDELQELKGLPEFKGLVQEVLQEVRAAVDDKKPEETDEQREKRLGRVMEEQRKLRAVIFEAADVHERITSTHKLVDAVVKLQTLERKAFNLDKDDGKGGNGSFESMLDKVLE